MRSIRGFLLSRLLAGSVAVLALGGALVFLFFVRSLEAQFDRNLADRVQGFASILFQVEDEVEVEFSEELMPEYDDAEAPAYFELAFPDGPLLERSPSLFFARFRLAGDRTPRFEDEPEFWTARLPDGREGRFVAQEIEVHHVYPEEGPDRPEARRVQVVVARGREDLVRAENTVLVFCVLAVLLLCGLVAALSWWTVARALAPVRSLASTLDALEINRLPSELELPPMPEELSPMADTARALVDRVEEALDRERRTTADIAHELRTPISELITVSDVALRGGDEPGELKRGLSMIRDTAWRMGRSVSTILKLAWLEMGSEEHEAAPIDLALLIRDQLRPLNSLARDRGLTIQQDVPFGDTAFGDPDSVRIIVANLIGNALRYAPAGDRVVLRLEDSGPERWELSVENRARDLSPEDLDSLADPFWTKRRKPADRHRFGLGLALSRALAERADLALHFHLTEGNFRAALSGPGREELRRTERSA